jgi:hypothetical protein
MLFHQDEPGDGNEASANTRSRETAKRRIEITVEREMISITRSVEQPRSNVSAANHEASALAEQLAAWLAPIAMERTETPLVQSAESAAPAQGQESEE